MKITDLAIVFILFTIPFLLVVKIKSDNLEYISYRQVELNRIIETSIDDATSMLIEDDEINKDRAVDIFFRSLFINLNIFNDSYLKYNLCNYIPAIVIIENDGFDILSLKEFNNVNDKKEMKMIWNSKIKYIYSDDKFIYQFFLDDKLNVYEKSTNKTYKGTYDLICDEADIINSILENEESYNVIKRREIINLLLRDVNYEINEHNYIVKNLGIDYQFSLPTITNDDWTNTITDVGMLVFFQGMPLGSQGDIYSNFVLGGSKLLKQRKYYVVIKKDTGKKEYHIEGCPILETAKLDVKTNPNTTIYRIEEYDTKYDAAKSGAFRCELLK
jgi:hypothetical protein